MSTRYVHQSAGTDDLQTAYGDSAGIKVDTDDDSLKFKDNDGNIKVVQTVGGAQEGVTYSADGAISPTAGVAVITKGSIATMTLAAPTAAQAGTVLIITSTTAFAHVVTATSLIGDGVTGSPHTTATFAAFIGATITLIAENLIWNEVSAKGVTVT
jgi:hypothetical protein